MSNKQLFFSHTWKSDNLGRDNHARVCELARQLKKRGWGTWIDEEDMGGNIDAAMAAGIDGADVIIVCLTEMYCKKVNETAKDPRKRDNCLKEWTYANSRDKLMIPVIMEPCLYNISNWPPGVVTLYLGSTLYIDATSDDLDKAVIYINKTLLTYKLRPHNDIDIEFKRKNKFIGKLKNKVYNTYTDENNTYENSEHDVGGPVKWTSRNNKNVGENSKSDKNDGKTEGDEPVVEKTEIKTEIKTDDYDPDETGTDESSQYEFYQPKLPKFFVKRRSYSLPHRTPPKLCRSQSMNQLKTTIQMTRRLSDINPSLKELSYQLPSKKTYLI